MHGAAHWVAFNMWHVGGTLIVQSNPRRLDPDDIWSTVERERVNALQASGQYWDTFDKVWTFKRVPYAGSFVAASRLRQAHHCAFRLCHERRYRPQ